MQSKATPKKLKSIRINPVMGVFHGKQPMGTKKAKKARKEQAKKQDAQPKEPGLPSAETVVRGITEMVTTELRQKNVAHDMWRHLSTSFIVWAGMRKQTT